MPGSIQSIWTSLKIQLLLASVTAALIVPAHGDDPQIDLANGLVFHCSFDDGAEASLSTDDGMIHTAATIARRDVTAGINRPDVTIAKGAGRFGDALRFTAVSKQVLLYKGINVPYRESDWSGTVSFWLKLDPDKDLKPGFCDPIQITDKTWNDAAMWVDFDKELPRDLRLGVFPNFGLWNPDNAPYETIPSDARPWVPVENPPFGSTEWTHVAWTFENVNTDAKAATVVLYLNAEPQGKLTRPLRFDWEIENVAIMLGINYIGDFDDLAIYNRPLNQAEIQELGRTAVGTGSSAQQQSE